MRVQDNSPLAITLALRDPTRVTAAIRALRDTDHPTAVDGLVELAAESANPRLAAAALAALPKGPLATDAARTALASQSAVVRLAGIELITRHRLDGLEHPLTVILTTDPSWPNRRAALRVLAGLSWPARWSILHAADDPHWRVRHSLIIDLVETRGDDRDKLRDRLARLGESPRVRGLWAYLEWAWTGEPATWQPPSPTVSSAVAAFSDPDPAVIGFTLARLGLAGRSAAVDVMAELAGHEDDRVWKPAVDAVKATGTPKQFARVVRCLDDPRTGTSRAVDRLFAGLPRDRRVETAAFIRDDSTSTSGQRHWAEEQLDTSPPPTPEVTYGSSHPFARAAALTPEMAAALVAEPNRETSWHVLQAACRMAKVPIWNIEPITPWQPEPDPMPAAEPIAATPGRAPHLAHLGDGTMPVSRVGISGHYQLPVEGFTRAAEAGVNWFFWEPNYTTLTTFSERLRPADRRDFRFVAGTFEADPRRVVQDAERAIRTLGVDRLGLFLVFWARTSRRLTDELRAAMHELKASGKTILIGLSAHDRTISVRRNVRRLGRGHGPAQCRSPGGRTGGVSGRRVDRHSGDYLQQSLLWPTAPADRRADPARPGRLLPILAVAARRRRLLVGTRDARSTGREPGRAPRPGLARGSTSIPGAVRG